MNSHRHSYLATMSTCLPLVCMMMLSIIATPSVVGGNLWKPNQILMYWRYLHNNAPGHVSISVSWARSPFLWLTLWTRFNGLRNCTRRKVVGKHVRTWEATSYIHFRYASYQHRHLSTGTISRIHYQEVQLYSIPFRCPSKYVSSYSKCFWSCAYLHLYQYCVYRRKKDRERLGEKASVSFQCCAVLVFTSARLP